MKSASINSDFFVGARMFRAENRNVYKIHEEGWPQCSCSGSLSTEHMYRMCGMPILQEQKSVTQLSRKKIINRGTLEVY
jgi:hypothetical protein